MKIGLLEAGKYPAAAPDGPQGYGPLFEALLAGQGLAFETYALFDGRFPASASDCDGWLITGSKLGAYDDDPLIAPLEVLTREIVAARRPLVGICFGHQIIAQALGGRVEKWRGGWGLGSTLYDGPEGAFKLNAFHQDQVVALPDGARVIASAETCEYAAFRIGDHVLTYQAHPEFTNPVFTQMLKIREDILPDALLASAEARLGEALDTDRIVKAMVAQLKKETAHE